MNRSTRIAIIVIGQALLGIGLAAVLINRASGMPALAICVIGWAVSILAAVFWSGHVDRRVAKTLDVLDIALPADLNAADDPDNLPWRSVCHVLLATIAVAALVTGI